MKEGYIYQADMWCKDCGLDIIKGLKEERERELGLKFGEVHAEYLYSGMIDYWSGDGRRWDRNRGCLFAYYDNKTTCRELIKRWIDDWASGGDLDEVDMSVEDLRSALREVFTVGDLDEVACPDGPDPPGEDEEDVELPQIIVLVTVGDWDFDPEDQTTYDSDEFPKSCDVSGGSDTIQHCAAGGYCINAETLPSGRKIGCWLENDLTTDGQEYLVKTINEGGEVAEYWKECYADWYDLNFTTCPLCGQEFCHQE